MVLISGQKYACETCIKGHRSSACQHTDRALFEIKKKGRPVTQCEHCRELRKTKQVHVKCLCESKEDAATLKIPKAPSKKKGGNKVPENAAFPNGLPEALEAFVVLPTTEGSSDSDHSEGCNCKHGGECHCCTPRKSAPRNRKVLPRASLQAVEETEVYPRAITDTTSKRPHPRPSNTPLSSHILARIAELRPVLPRPVTSSGPLHDPSSGIAHGSGVRHHTHENMFYSPYGRAYDHVHPVEHVSHDRSTRDDRSVEVPTAPQPSRVGEPFSTDVPRVVPTAWPNGGSFPSLCGCGDICTCPGCVEHNPDASTARASVHNVFASCTNPGACATCLDCTILSLPSSIPPDSDLSTYGGTGTHVQSIDAWIRQVEALPMTAPLHQQVHVPPPAPWDSTQAPYEPKADSSSDSECKCPPGSCACEMASCGFGQGCVCDDVYHREQLTFATSGEREEPSSQVEMHVGAAAVGGGTRRDLLDVSFPRRRENGSGSSSSQSSLASSPPRGLTDVGRILSTSRTTNLAIPTSNMLSRGSSTVVSPPALSRAPSNDGMAYTKYNPDLDPPRSEYNGSTLYAVSNPDSDHSHEEYEYRQSTGAVYALSNPDSELSHEEYDYDPRFDFGPAQTSGEDLATYATGKPDSDPALATFEYGPSLDGMQIY